MSSPSAHAEPGPIVSVPPVNEPHSALDQLSRKDSRTYSSSSITLSDTGNVESQLVPLDSSPKGSPAYSQSSRANEPSTVAQQVVLYLAGDQDDEDDRDVRHPSSSPARAIVNWLATAGSAASKHRSQDRQTTPLCASSSSYKRKANDPESLPSSPSSSVLEAFVDKVLGPEFARKGPYHSKSMKHNTKPAADRAARCDRCRSRNLKCTIVSKTGASCSNCRRAHLARERQSDSSASPC